jgi:hypothetical protein
MAPIKKEREGRDLNLRLPPLDGGIQQPIIGWHRQRIRGGGNGALGNNKGVGCVPIIWGLKQATEKIKIERAMGPGCQSITNATTNQKIESFSATKYKNS